MQAIVSPFPRAFPYWTGFQNIVQKFCSNLFFLFKILAICYHWSQFECKIRLRKDDLTQAIVSPFPCAFPHWTGFQSFVHIFYHFFKTSIFSREGRNAIVIFNQGSQAKIIVCQIRLRKENLTHEIVSPFPCAVSYLTQF